MKGGNVGSSTLIKVGHYFFLNVCDLIFFLNTCAVRILLTVVFKCSSFLIYL